MPEGRDRVGGAILRLERLKGVLIGLAIANHTIRSLDDPVTAYVSELKGSAYDGVTIRQALMPGASSPEGLNERRGTHDFASA